MFETLFVDPTTVERYRAAPLCAERVRYLEHCRDSGFAQDTLEKVARNQLRLVLLLDMRGRDPVTVSQIEAAAETWSRPGMLRSCFAGSPVAKSEFVYHMRGWLRYLGRLEEPEEPPLHPHTAEVAAFAEWARAERGYAETSIDSYCWVADQFLAFLADGETDHPACLRHSCRYRSSVCRTGCPSAPAAGIYFAVRATAPSLLSLRRKPRLVRAGDCRRDQRPADLRERGVAAPIDPGRRPSRSRYDRG